MIHAASGVFGRSLRLGAMFAVLLGAATLSARPAEATHCRLALVLALDISHSVDREEQTLQSKGLAAALLSPDVKDAILSPTGAVSALAFRWSGLREQYIVADWTLLDSEAAIEAFATRIAETPLERWGKPTALGRAMAYARWLHSRNPYSCDARVLDVSGDGVNNEGRPPSVYRAEGQLDGMIINGLVIRNDHPDPLPYYIEHVIQGPGAFVIDIDSYGDYAAAMERKLLRELSPMFAQLSE